MKILIIIISILLIPISAKSTDWNHIGQFGKDNNGGVTEKLICHNENNCTFIVSNTNFFNVYKSYNGGLSWQLIYKSKTTLEDTKPTAANISDVSMPDTNNILITYFDNFIIQKSTNGGKTFNKIIVKDSNSSVNNLVMYDSQIGFATFGNHFYLTNDGWVTWIIKPNNIYPQLDFPKFLNKDTVQFLSYLNDNKSLSNYNFITSEVIDLFYFAKNFSQDNSFKNGLWGFHNYNDKLKYFVGGRKNGIGDQKVDIVYRTTDGGYNWDKVHDMEMEPKFGLEDISCYDEKNCMAVGKWGKVLMTKDGGNTWIYHPEGEEPFIRLRDSIYGPPVMKVTWAGKTPLIATTFGCNLYRYEGDFFDFGTSVEDTQPINTSIFPNPSSDKISLDLGDVAVADLVVYDILGNEIMAIPNYSNKSEIDVSNLSIGTYTIQIQTSKGSISQRLLVNR